MTEQSRVTTAYPTLTEEQMALLASQADEAEFADGEALFHEGESDFSFFVIKSGAVRITENSTGEEKEVTTHHPGEFTGDIDMLTSQRSLVTASAAGSAPSTDPSAAARLGPSRLHSR